MKKLILVGVIAVISANGAHAQTQKDVVGVLRIDSGTEYVFLSAKTLLGGACTGWNTVSIQKIGQRSPDMTKILCWKERDGYLRVASERGESPKKMPMSEITTPN
ncbi:hypothetical protein GN109_23355 [Collimonas pratensis]|uniref:hypothetical protein n=1 Tax=Collimonas pratensis TaxID=279113 RepID=UPI00143CF474|nr:hypothetical protein [Collimonas pratensis]NKI72367.1 hypothetical protein [Collimonas pratensis]